MKVHVIALTGLVYMLCGSPSPSAEDRYILVDWDTSRNLFAVTPRGDINAITSRVPWQRAHSLAIDSQGNYLVTVDIYAATGDRDGLYRVTPKGFITPVAIGKPFAEPTGVEIDAAGNAIVLNTTRGGRGQILQVTPAGRVTVLFEGHPLIYPTDLAIDSHGHYVITDRAVRAKLYGASSIFKENGAVYRFDPVTKALTIVHSSADTNGNLLLDNLMGHLSGVDIDAQGNYIIVESQPHLTNNNEWKIPIGNPNILKMRPNGQIYATIQIPVLDDHIPIALGIAIDSNGNYIVADAVGVTNNEGRLLRVTPNGQVSTIVMSPRFGKTGDVAVLAGGRSAAKVRRSPENLVANQR